MVKEGLTYKSMSPRTDCMRGVSPEDDLRLVDAMHLSVNANKPGALEAKKTKVLAFSKKYTCIMYTCDSCRYLLGIGWF